MLQQCCGSSGIASEAVEVVIFVLKVVSVLLVVAVVAVIVVSAAVGIAVSGAGVVAKVEYQLVGIVGCRLLFLRNGRHRLLSLLRLFGLLLRLDGVCHNVCLCVALLCLASGSVAVGIRVVDICAYFKSL